MLRPFVPLLAAAVATGAVAQPVRPTPPPTAPASALQRMGMDADAYHACLTRFAAVGLPRHVSAEGKAEQEIPVICRAGYALSFNKVTRSPDWVIELLDRSRFVGDAKRRSSFPDDPWLTGEPSTDEYKGTNFDRGHQAPAADAKFDQTVMNESFFMSNMSPQVGIGFNRGQWAYLEGTVRDWVLCGGRERIIVITGPIYGDKTPKIGPGRNIVVPDAYYKIVYDLTSRRAVGFRLENRVHRSTPISDFVVPIREIEDQTGLDFFANLPNRRQNQLEVTRGVAWGHHHCN